MFAVRKATQRDAVWIREVLRKAQMNNEGVDEHLEQFLVIEDSRQPGNRVGTVGLEIYGKRGLLRSFVLDQVSWNAATGLKLIGVVLTHASRLGLEEVYLMTGNAQPIFEYFGFVPVKWEDMPNDIRQSDHASYARDLGGVAMVNRPLSDHPVI
jgi:amino-acid N-acetyltransferase